MSDTPTRQRGRGGGGTERGTSARPPRREPAGAASKGRSAGRTKAAGARGGKREPAPRRGAKDLHVVESTVEPRIVERRRQVRAEARRSRNRRWMVLGGAVAVVALGIGALFSPLLDVDKVTVSGAGHYSSEQVARMSGVVTGDHLVSVDLPEVRTRLMSDPWIASAGVSRRFPGTVDVKVIEESPLLTFVAEDATLLVSHSGRILEVANAGAGPSDEPSGTKNEESSDSSSTKPSAKLPRVEYSDSISGIERVKNLGGIDKLVGERPEGVIADAAILVKRLPSELDSQVDVIRFAADGSVNLELSNGAEVKFGQPDEIEAKVVATRSVLDQVVLDCLKTVDVREPTRAAVSRGPGCPGISPEAPAGRTGGGSKSSTTSEKASKASEDSQGTGGDAGSTGTESGNSGD